ncbi:acetamidase/formamidase family protein [Curtobacterium sp. MCLR17_036]|uniref:acetamidase/formamidase family protein n=1 Tax=Curtobacterium sp. MCLR17_036 TaxID=2175620 RepID=UPI001C649881|nr:acetamidase/formamidase family protein [Curtobacterium sp. MCLR17_036]WIE65496.1 acetamidase/formamidase family protein [Curtobacterium sp. MCLR17_036]
MPTTHRLESTADSAVDVLTAERRPVLTVAPGDTVTVHTLSAAGYTERQPAPGVDAPTLIDPRRGHCLVGPIAVTGARPGAVLAVRFDDLVPDDWGYTGSGGVDTPVNRALGLTDPASRGPLLWDIDPERGVAVNQLGLGVRTAPFLGVVGLPPEPAGEHSTIPPRPLGGGNIDCRELVAGSTLYLPVTVPDALLSVGDGHAAQGDGEVSGTAVECGMTTTMTLTLLDTAPVEGVHADTPAGRITFGFDADLNAATATALDRMVDWIVALHGTSRAEALAMASVAVSMRVTQVANRTWGVHALLPHDAILTGASLTDARH